MNTYVPDSLIPILISFPTYDTSLKFSQLFYENYKDLPQHKVLFDEYVVYTRSDVYKGYKLGSIEYKEVYGSQQWYKNGKHHRGNDEPAYIEADGTKSWWKNGKLHRENDKPARIYSDGTQRWYKDGKIHRENDKPAIIWYTGLREWWTNGALCAKQNIGINF